MQEHRRAVTGWSGALALAALAGAALARHVTWLFIAALLAAVLFLVVLLASGLPDLTGWLRRRRKPDEAPKPDQAPPVQVQSERPPVFTETWRHTTAGGEVPAVMMALQKNLHHPGYARRAAGSQPPVIRFATLVSCDRLGDRPATTELRQAFLRFLRLPPIWSVITELTDLPEHLSWHSYAGNGRINNGAILSCSEDDESAPVASAILNLNDAETALWGQASWAAELVLCVEPRNEGSEPDAPATLTECHGRLVAALKVPEAFARFLTEDLGLATHGDPVAQFGVRLEAYPSLRSLVDVSEFKAVPGAPIAASFYSYVIADRNGKTPELASADILRGWCDHGLYIEGYEGILELDPRRRAQFALGPQPSELRRQVVQMRDLCDEVIADGGKDSGWFLHGDRKFTAAHLRDESDRLGDHKLRELARAAAQAWDSTFAAAPPPRPARVYNLNRPDMYRDEDLAHDSRRARATDGADVAKVQCGLVIARLNELEARGI